ncbi:MAG TPA: 50S ribosomal protein L23 [Candidatus Mcinerneyibacteriales bacterium]|jgi:large subunit ribosomal protein L23|nr:50S ribosomal protein L23 [Candidatus Mcinerneyibacteriota bacterium]HOO60632.1 50S ribosomal protein L23 [Candidatus Mcinerneyibacteriales bacterium]HPJ70447.1 50S ribosomal protein L23 [Candidatus Mcinerneyibacteriales bacterium]HPQ89137.1 50S ribosomal protein L23 [Candidatus Mcinerneyibacteriales bacterium]
MKTPYDVIFQPVMTEKSLIQKEQENKYTFKVDKRAGKGEIKRAVEKMFNVKVKNVAIMNVLGKKKRVRIVEGKKPDWKKAIVTLAQGQKIDLFD